MGTLHEVLAAETAVDLEPGREVALDVQLGMGFSTTGKIVYRLPVAPGRFRLGIESTPAPRRLPPGGSAQEERR